MNKKQFKIALPNPKIYSTLAWLYIFVSICFLLYTCIILSNNNENDIKFNRIFLQLTQCLFCFAAIYGGYRINSNQEEESIEEEERKYEEIKNGFNQFKEKSPIAMKSIWNNAIENTKNFRNLILIVWSTWGIYFFYAALIRPEIETENFEVFVNPLEVLFNNITFVAFFSCFYKLDLPELKVTIEKVISWLAAVVIVFVIHIVLLKFYNNKVLINSIFLFLSGVLNAIAIAVFIGRLESKNISPPRVYVWIMFIYAALQPLIIISSFGEIKLHSDTEILSEYHMMTIANVRLWFLAIGKGIFLLFTLWLFESKRLIYYFMVTPELKRDRDAFDKIINDEFGMRVWGFDAPTSLF